MSDSPDDRTDADRDEAAERFPDAEDRRDERTHDDQSDATTDGGDDEGESPSYESSGSGMHARDVEVPMRVYKTVTVFSTLIAVIFVVGGFVLLDRATGRAQLPLSKVDPVVAVLGIGAILFGAATYAFGTRFRAAGMGSSKNDDDEAADNG